MNSKIIILIISLLIWGKEAKTQLHIGMSMYFEYNLYQWYQKPTTISPIHRSTGQVFNVLPSAGMGVWVGRSDRFFVNIEGGMDYMPFSLDLEEYGGLGAISFPVVARAILPFSGDKGISSFVGLGFGVQWSKNELYAYPKGQQPTTNPFYATLVAEVTMGVGMGWDTDDKNTGMIAVFSRFGFAAEYALTFNCGLRAKILYNPTAKPKKRPLDQPKTYQVLLQTATEV